MQSNFHQISNLHFAVSINHKTELYVGIPWDEILWGDKNWIRLFNAMRMCNTPTIYKIPVRFISDGKRAYIKPLVTWGEILECAKKLGIDILKYV